MEIKPESEPARVTVIYKQDKILKNGVSLYSQKATGRTPLPEKRLGVLYIVSLRYKNFADPKGERSDIVFSWKFKKRRRREHLRLYWVVQVIK